MSILHFINIHCSRVAVCRPIVLSIKRIYHHTSSVSVRVQKEDVFLGPSIYNVHMEGEEGQAQVDACGRGRGPTPCGRSHRKLKLESTDVIMSSSHAKKLESYLPEFRLWTE